MDDEQVFSDFQLNVYNFETASKSKPGRYATI